MSAEDTRRFLLRMKFDCDFFYEIAEIEDPHERTAHISSLGYAVTHEEIRRAFGRPLPAPDHCDEKPIRETLWEEKQPTFECKAVYVGDSSVLLSVGGAFDMAAAAVVKRLLGRLAAEGITDHLAVDLSDCTFVDSTGLSVLVEAQKVANTPLNVAAANEDVRSALTVTGLADFFNVCDTREDALEALERHFGVV